MSAQPGAVLVRHCEACSRLDGRVRWQSVEQAKLAGAQTQPWTCEGCGQRRWRLVQARPVVRPPMPASVSGGRPRGSGALTSEQLRDLVLRHADTAWRASPGHGPTISSAAAAIGLSEGGLAKAFRRHGLRWSELRAASFEQALLR
jgi:hypothetical protein